MKRAQSGLHTCSDTCKRCRTIITRPIVLPGGLSGNGMPDLRSEGNSPWIFWIGLMTPVFKKTFLLSMVSSMSSVEAVSAFLGGTRYWLTGACNQANAGRGYDLGAVKKRSRVYGAQSWRPYSEAVATVAYQ